MMSFGELLLAWGFGTLAWMTTDIVLSLRIRQLERQLRRGQ